VIDGVAIILQARMGSRRLPGKTLASIAGRTVLEHCVERLRAASDMQVILATTTRPEDDCLEQEGARLGVAVMRGPDEDVLGRFVMVASALSLTVVVRATADNPAVDMDSPRRVLDALCQAGADHVVEDGLPYGTTVEAMSAEALIRQHALAVAAADREHVTPFMRRDPRFTSVRVMAPEAVRRPDLRFTVDTALDLEFVRRVFENCEAEAGRPVPLAALIAAAERLTGAPAPSDRV
jgi:spore coat polysaccharide biosynthesis protein SpsF (cytidylyltransferase family)